VSVFDNENYSRENLTVYEKVTRICTSVGQTFVSKQVHVVLTHPGNITVTILTAPQVEAHLRSNTAPNL
jgi:hypothetical protein